MHAQRHYSLQLIYSEQGERTHQHAVSERNRRVICNRSHLLHGKVSPWLHTKDALKYSPLHEYTGTQACCGLQYECFFTLASLKRSLLLLKASAAFV